MKGEILERYVAELAESRFKAHYISYARAFLEYAGTLDDTQALTPEQQAAINAVNRETVTAYLKKMRRQGKAPGTVAWIFSVIRAMFRVNKIEWPFRHGEGPQVGQRCPICRKYCNRDGHPLGQKCRSSLANPGPTCPRCMSTATRKGGLTKYGIQMWRCTVCRRAFVEHKRPRDEDTESNRHPSPVAEGTGICLRCGGAPEQVLANGLCVACFDTVSIHSEVYYWRRRYLGLCIQCGYPNVDIGAYCSDCRQRRASWRRARTLRRA